MSNYGPLLHLRTVLIYRLEFLSPPSKSRRRFPRRQWWVRAPGDPSPTSSRSMRGSGATQATSGADGGADFAPGPPVSFAPSPGEAGPAASQAPQGLHPVSDAGALHRTCHRAQDRAVIGEPASQSLVFQRGRAWRRDSRGDRVGFGDTPCHRSGKHIMARRLEAMPLRRKRKGPVVSHLLQGDTPKQ